VPLDPRPVARPSTTALLCSHPAVCTSTTVPLAARPAPGRAHLRTAQQLQLRACRRWLAVQFQHRCDGSGVLCSTDAAHQLREHATGGTTAWLTRSGRQQRAPRRRRQARTPGSAIAAASTSCGFEALIYSSLLGLYHGEKMRDWNQFVLYCSTNFAHRLFLFSQCTSLLDRMRVCSHGLCLQGSPLAR
jgi:hypothetical protein